MGSGDKIIPYPGPRVTGICERLGADASGANISNAKISAGRRIGQKVGKNGLQVCGARAVRLIGGKFHRIGEISQRKEMTQ
jgi:hypothetical protein